VKVVVFPADAWACGHYRVIWPANVLQGMGWDIHIVPPDKKTGFQVRTEELPDGSTRLLEVQAPECDLVVLQRPGHHLQPQLIPALRKAGIAVLVDMDDDMSTLAKTHIAYDTYSTRSGSDFSWRNALESCKVATFVTTSTSELQRIYASHGRGMVLDNYVPEVYLDMDEPKPEPGFGWAGTTASHPDDLQVCGTAVAKLQGEGHKFSVVGDGKQVTSLLRLKSEPHVTGGVGLADWARTIQATLQVGMVPLAPTRFNTSKSRLKGIEYMAGGIPWVASPRQEYRRLTRESGCGLLADTPKDWYRQLKLLLTDDVLRKEQTEKGLEFMKDQTYQAQAWRWAEAWTKAVEIQRG
jgi:hypothetical protein